MAGVTDYAFRELCASLAPIATTTEMVSSKGLIYGDKKSHLLMQIAPMEHQARIQLFGSESEIMARAAAEAEKVPGVTGLDVNMGCPIGKIAGSGDGSALMKDIPRAAAIVRAMRTATALPVSVKFRKGWDSGQVNCVEFALAMEDAGADALCVHGRTKTQMYSGHSDFAAIAAVKKAVRVPVTASGDIFDAESALECRRKTGADTFMVGRGAFGNPWLCAQVLAALEGRPVPELPPLEQRLETARAQIFRAAESKGEKIASLEARKHLAWYLRGTREAARFRGWIMKVESLADVERVIRDIVRYLEETQDMAPHGSGEW